jgi:sugar/nucleoside kinase (ribokinase family)
MSARVLVVGSYNLDVIFTGLPSEPVLGEEIYVDDAHVTIGGGTYPSGMVFRRLGLDTHINMLFGSDFFSSFAVKILTDSGFDPAYFNISDHSMQRITVALSYPQDRAFVSFAEPPVIDEGRSLYGPGPLQRGQFDHVHVAHLSAGLEAADLIAEARKQGVQVSMDCGWNIKAIRDPRLWDTLRSVDIFLPNEKEAIEITGAADLASAYKRFADEIPMTVVKLGKQGSIAITKESQTHMPSIEVEVVDTTAAGDCFNAGFIFGLLQGYPIREALLAGNICGALSVTAPGWENAPDRQQLEDQLRSIQRDEL